MTADATMDILLDVTRLIWRRWRGGLPTGVDRVCLAYLEHFGPRARAVIQRRGVHLTLSHHQSSQLFNLLLDQSSDFRKRLVLVGAKALWRSLSGFRPPAGAVYLNVGHTGLDEPSLPAWIVRYQLRAVYLIHDLIPITHPQFCRPGEDRKHMRRMINVLVSASGIIGNSQATVDEVAALAARHDIPMPANVAVWLGGNVPLRADGIGSAGRPYYVVLGTIEGRKNHQLLLEVWSRLVAQFGGAAPRLVIVGKRGWEAEKIFDQLDSLGPLASYIEERSRCSDEELAPLMAGARALLMPSFAEGYGLPVFEALELGTPVIAADLPVYREVAGAIPFYLPPDDVTAWERALSSYATDGPERLGQLQRMQGFKAPDWKHHFAAVEGWLTRLLIDKAHGLNAGRTP